MKEGEIMEAEVFTLLNTLKEEILMFFDGFDVSFAFDERDVSGIYLKPLIVLDGAYKETNGEKTANIRATFIADEGYDLSSPEVLEVIKFISDNLKIAFPSVISVSLGYNGFEVYGRFKSKVLEIKAAPKVNNGEENALVNGTKCIVQGFTLKTERESKAIWQMCNSEPVSYIKEKEVTYGIIKNCSIAPEFLENEFDFTYNGKKYKGCNLIYVEGEAFIREAKFYIGSIE